MLKKLMLVATAAMALFAIGAQGASANWYDDHVALNSEENPHVFATGTSGFTSQNGGVDCLKTDATIQLTGGTTTGHLKSLVITEPTTCEVTGGLVFLTGGTTTLKSATLTPGAQVHIVGDDLQLTGVSTHTEFHNGFKMTLTSTSTPLTGTVDNSTKITTVAFHGTLGSAIGNIGFQINLHVHDATYGLTAG